MVNETVRNRIMIMLTLSNRKIYIGHPNQVTRDESGRERWISIVPWIEADSDAKHREVDPDNYLRCGCCRAKPLTDRDNF